MPKDTCSELAKKITELAMHIGARPEVKNLDDVVTHMQKLVPQIDRTSLVASINEATTGYAKAKAELTKKLDAIKREARNDTKLREAIRQMEGHISGGTQPTPQPRPTIKTPKAIADLRAERDRLAGILEMADPAKRQAVRDRITELDAHIKAGTMPPKAPTKEVPADLASLRRMRDEKLREVRMADPAKRAAIRKEIAELSGAIKKGEYVPKEPTQSKATPADLQKLRQERDRLRAQVDKFNPDRVAEWQARVDKLEGHLRAGTLPEASPASPEANPRVAELKDRRDELLAAIRQSDAAIKKRYLADIQNLTDRLENGVFTLPEPKVKRPMDRELLGLDYQRFELKKRIRGEIEKLKPKTIWGVASEPFNAARAIKTAFDVSAVMRQGGFIALGNPVRAAKALPDMFRAMKSEENSYRINKAIFERENAPLYHRDGLFLSEPGTGGLSKQEEVFVSKLAGAIPGVKASERAYVTFLNKIRADTYDALTASLAKDGMVTEEEGRAIANFINVATGRGKLPGSLEKAADAMNTIFFAPRYVTSRFQLLAGQPLYGGTAATRKMIAREYAKFVAGIGVVLGLGKLAGGDVEIDPRSADFGKIRFGETRLDPMAGLSQALVFVVRSALGETKTASGEIQPLRGEGARSTVADNAFRFVRSKLAPVPGAVFNTFAGEDVVGTPTNAAREAVGLFDPIGRRDIMDALREQGIEKGSLLSAVSLFGAGMNTYGPHTEAGELMGELEDAGLKGSGLYSGMQRLHAEYKNADDKRRTQISDQLDRINKQAKKVLKAREKRPTP